MEDRAGCAVRGEGDRRTLGALTAGRLAELVTGLIEDRDTREATHRARGGAGVDEHERCVELAGTGFGLERLSVLVPLSLIASNSIGNVPAVVLLIQIWHAAPPGALYALALLSTLAGNLLLLGSLANLIVLERAAAVGVRLGFAEHARCGIPMTLASTLVAVLWLVLAGHAGL